MHPAKQSGVKEVTIKPVFQLSAVQQHVKGMQHFDFLSKFESKKDTYL